VGKVGLPVRQSRKLKKLFKQRSGRVSIIPEEKIKKILDKVKSKHYNRFADRDIGSLDSLHCQKG
jgi:hypothetical protein